MTLLFPAVYASLSFLYRIASPGLFDRVGLSCARASSEVVPERQPSFPVGLAQADDMKVVCADFVLRSPDEQVAAHVRIFTSIDESRFLYGWDALLDRVWRLYPNRDVEDRLGLQSGNCCAAEVLDLARHRRKSLGQYGALFAEGFPPRRRVFRQRDGAAPKPQSCRWRCGFGHASRISSGFRRLPASRGSPMT